MKAVLPQITAVLLVLHAVLGCCWHHGHVDSSDCGCVYESAGVEHSESPACGHGEHGQPKCLGGACVFTAQSKQPTIQPTFSVDRLPTADRWAVKSPVVLHDGGVSAFAASFLLPVRLHVAHQVFLI
jgi:hypothetical protein